MERHELLENLLVMAAADRAITQSEMELLADRCLSWGIADNQFAKMIERAFSADAELRLPPSHSDRIQLLTELIHMMAADGQLADIEKQLFASAAAAMQVSQAELNRIIDAATRAS